VNVMLDIKVGQRWVIPVFHLDGREVVHRVTHVTPTWVSVEVEENVNGYAGVPRRRFEDENLRQAPAR
jgi:hypothetical protein